MEFINHFTLNTGDNRKSYPKEVFLETLEKLKPMVSSIIDDGGTIPYLENTYLKITMLDDDQYVASLHIDCDGVKMPVFMSIATSNPQKRKNLEQDVNGFRKNFQFMMDGIYLIPNPPVIVDILLPGIMIREDLMSLTGDLSRCMAWTILDPDSVIRVHNPVKKVINIPQNKISTEE